MICLLCRLVTAIDWIVSLSELVSTSVGCYPFCLCPGILPAVRNTERMDCAVRLSVVFESEERALHRQSAALPAVDAPAFAVMCHREN